MKLLPLWLLMTLLASASRAQEGETASDGEESSGDQFPEVEEGAGDGEEEEGDDDDAITVDEVDEDDEGEEEAGEGGDDDEGAQIFAPSCTDPKDVGPCKSAMPR